MLEELLRLLVPPRCLACGRAARDVLCGACRLALPWLRDACPRCALPRPCSPCPAARQRFAAAWAPVAHDGSARALVHALKFRSHLAAADVMAAQMAAVLPRAGPPGGGGAGPGGGGVAHRGGGAAPGAALDLAGAALVPVPFAPARRRRRGFDHADLLATRLSARTGHPVVRCLRRSGRARQVGSARSARLRAPRIEAEGRAPPVALLVDDVHTTGATLDACAQALTTGGTRTVLAVTYARTVRRA